MVNPSSQTTAPSPHPEAPWCCAGCGYPPDECGCDQRRASKTTTTIPSSQDGSDIEAMVAATGRTEADVVRILDALMEAGWVLRPLPMTDAQRRKQARDRKKQIAGFRL